MKKRLYKQKHRDDRGRAFAALGGAEGIWYTVDKGI